MENLLFDIQPTKGHFSFVVAAAGGKILSSFESAPPPANAIRKNQTGTLKIRYWGDDNLYPQFLIDWVEKSPILAAKLPFQASALCSGGIIYGRKTKAGFQPEFDPEVETWIKSTNLKRFLPDFAVELVKFWNGFAELIPSADRSKIARIVAHDSAFCRISRNDLPEFRNKPQRVYISANWPEGDSEDSELTINREMIDEYGDRIEQIRSGKESAYMYRIMGPSSGRVDYGEPPWTAALKSKWLQYSLAIPEAKLAKITNGMMVFYHIEVPEDYWRAKYPDWDEKPELSQSRKKETLDEWIGQLTDKKNWGKAILTSYTQFMDGKTGKHISIKVLENPFTKGELIEDSFEASAQIYQAMMLDATLNGTIPGKQMGAGSGSDKREAWNLMMLAMKPIMDLILEPVQFCFDYNGWDYEVLMGNYYIATQDQVSPDKRNIGNPNPANPV